MQQVRETNTTYSFMARNLHWINAILLIATWALHELMKNNPSLLRLHILLGTLALVSTVLQIVWYLVDKKPEELPGLPAWRKFAIDWNHRLILLAALLASATGLGITLGSGLGLIPSITDMARIQEGIFKEPHELMSNALMLLFLMHIAGILWYQFAKGNTMGRMAPELFGRKNRA